jgi:hypothetical protein
MANDVHDAETFFSMSIPLIRRFAIPAHSFGVVLRDAIAVVVHKADIGLCVRVALIG